MQLDIDFSTSKFLRKKNLKKTFLSLSVTFTRMLWNVIVMSKSLGNRTLWNYDRKIMDSLFNLWNYHSRSLCRLFANRSKSSKHSERDGIVIIDAAVASFRLGRNCYVEQAEYFRRNSILASRMPLSCPLVANRRTSCKSCKRISARAKNHPLAYVWLIFLFFDLFGNAIRVLASLFLEFRRVTRTSPGFWSPRLKNWRSKKVEYKKRVVFNFSRELWNISLQSQDQMFH